MDPLGHGATSQILECGRKSIDVRPHGAGCRSTIRYSMSCAGQTELTEPTEWTEMHVRTEALKARPEDSPKATEYPVVVSCVF